jgi:hypothetical protein
MGGGQPAARPVRRTTAPEWHLRPQAAEPVREPACDSWRPAGAAWPGSPTSAPVAWTRPGAMTLHAPGRCDGRPWQTGRPAPDGRLDPEEAGSEEKGVVCITPRRRHHTGDRARLRFSFDGAWWLPVAMRGPLSLNDCPDDQAQRCADDHAEGNLGAAADQYSENDTKRRTQCQTQSRCLSTSVRSASHLRSPVVATALLTGSPL